MTKHPLDKIIFDKSTSPFDKIKAITARLRDKDTGCPWDKEQTHQSLTPYVIEEAYEVVDAINHSPEDLVKELGDLLLQVMLHAQIASEQNRFTIEDVCEAISNKLIVRHPHVFGEVVAQDSKTVLKNWEQIKQKELKDGKSILDGVPTGMPALLRAQRVSEKAARVGFEWATIDEIKDKVYEEIKEFNETISNKEPKDRVEDEFGDILFALTQVGRRLGINTEEALQRSTDKFSRRFKSMESRVTKPLYEHKLEELDGIWNEIKKEEKALEK